VSRRPLHPFDTAELSSELHNDWHHSRIVQAEMVHFLRQMQAFCQLEVIECSWQSLIDFTDKREGDLDALIQAHRTYLDRVVRKVLLLSSKRDKEVSQADMNFISSLTICAGNTSRPGTGCLGFRIAIPGSYGGLEGRTPVERF